MTVACCTTNPSSFALAMALCHAKLPSNNLTKSPRRAAAKWVLELVDLSCSSYERQSAIAGSGSGLLLCSTPDQHGANIFW